MDLFPKRPSLLLRLYILPILSVSGNIWGIEDALNYQELARQKYVERFSKFTQDKNVMGKAGTPDGKQVRTGNKQRFNRDDGAPFQSDLTYHDASFDKDEQVAKPTPTDPDNKEIRRLHAFISPHGGISAEGGSSLLERTVYQSHEKYAKEEDEKAKRGESPIPEKEGVDYKSIFKVITQELQKNPGAKGIVPPASTGKNTDDEIKRVERWNLRDEVKKEVEKVGTNSSESIIREARDPEEKDNQESMGNLSFYYESANRALQAWWNSTLANLGQARINRIETDLSDTVKLDEDTINGKEWIDRKRQELQQRNAKLGGSAKLDKSEEEALQKAEKKADEMAKVPYSTVNPDYVKEPSNGNNPPREELKSAGAEKEDPRERDLRLQLEVLAKAGIRLNELPSNWKFTDKDETAKVVINYDDEARPQAPTDLRVDEQLDLYNKQLEQATKAMQEVQAKLPGENINADRHVKYRIQPGSKSVMEITKAPESEYEALGIPNPPNALPIPQNYSDLLKRN